MLVNFDVSDFFRWRGSVINELVVVGLEWVEIWTYRRMDRLFCHRVIVSVRGGSSNFDIRGRSVKSEVKSPSKESIVSST